MSPLTPRPQEILPGIRDRIEARRLLPSRRERGPHPGFRALRGSAHFNLPAGATRPDMR